MKNKDLKEVYNRIYEKGDESFFTKFIDKKNVSETSEMVLSCTNWEGKNVLDFGCGKGSVSYLIASRGAASVIGIDYSKEAINKAQETYKAGNLKYHCQSIADFKDNVDVIVSCGTIEHTDNPAKTIQQLNELLKDGGEMILTCPCFLNIRGFIWMTLQTLFEVPMSLTDLHFISPFDIKKYLQDLPLHLVRTSTFDYDMANGKLMIKDMEKRLNNALRDAGLSNEKVTSLINWLEQVAEHNEINNELTLCGSNALYYIQKDKGL